MRIRDWSSDVCSSDLASVQQEAVAERVVRLQGEARRAGIVRGAGDLGDDGAVGDGAGLLDGRAGEARAGEALELPRLAERDLPAGPDLTSAVEGQSVAGRLELGGRPSITKKNE